MSVWDATVKKSVFTHSNKRSALSRTVPGDGVVPSPGFYVLDFYEAKFGLNWRFCTKKPGKTKLNSLKCGVFLEKVN